jgi:hypothetical protein
MEVMTRHERRRRKRRRERDGVCGDAASSFRLTLLETATFQRGDKLVGSILQVRE